MLQDRTLRTSPPGRRLTTCGHDGNQDQRRQPDDAPPPSSNVSSDGVDESPEAFWNQLEPGSTVGAQMICRLSPTVCTEKECQWPCSSTRACCMPATQPNA